MSIVITINDADISEQDKIMLQSVLGPVANALVEALKPQLEQMHNEVKAAYAARDQKLKDYEQVNERRIVLENEAASLFSANSRLKEQVASLTTDLATAKADVDKWVEEAEKLANDHDQALAKLREERDEARKQRDEITVRFAAVATRVHDLLLLVGGQTT